MTQESLSDSRSAQIRTLREFITVQAEEYRNRHALYGESARILENFPAGADSLDSDFDFHVRTFGMTAETKAVLAYLELKGRDRSLRLLDSGCGIGTQSLAFAALGYDVTGIDLNVRAVDLASSRAKFYSQRLGRGLQCSFLARNLLTEQLPPEYDVVWAREAISHVHPLEDYLRRTQEVLRPGGILAISDENWSNPLVKIALFRTQAKHYRPFRSRGEASVYFVTERPDPATGKAVPMAMERVLTLSRTLRLFEEACYTNVRCETMGLLPKTTIAKMLSKDERRQSQLFDFLARGENLLLRLPWIHRLGKTNLVVGSRP